MDDIKKNYFLPIEVLTVDFIKLIEETPTLFDTIQDECLTNEL